MDDSGSGNRGSGKVWLWMAACCIPILAVIVLGYCTSRAP